MFDLLNNIFILLSFDPAYNLFVALINYFVSAAAKELLNSDQASCKVKHFLL